MFEERVLLGKGRRMALRFASSTDYSLRIFQGDELLLEYANHGKGHRRRVRGREEAYEFRSVEQLRYDFERDAEDARRPG